MTGSGRGRDSVGGQKADEETLGQQRLQAQRQSLGSEKREGARPLATPSVPCPAWHQLTPGTKAMGFSGSYQD